jgi:hypothetical protein
MEMLDPASETACGESRGQQLERGVVMNSSTDQGGLAFGPLPNGGLHKYTLASRLLFAMRIWTAGRIDLESGNQT